MSKPYFLLYLLLCSVTLTLGQPIDRQAVVNRHQVVLTRADTLGSLTVGNGRFAFTVDATGLQSFPEAYAHGVPLGTQSEWGWHHFPNRENYRFEECLKTYDFNGQPRSYAVQSKERGRAQGAADYFRQNPHRLQLGNVGLVLLKRDGKPAQLADLQQVRQQLDPWTGTISSSFSVEGTPVSVTTCAHADQDVVAVRIESALLREGRIQVRFRFPYPTNAFADMGVNYTHAADHQTGLYLPTLNSARFSRQLDADRYVVTARWLGAVSLRNDAPHNYTLTPAKGDRFGISVQFSSKPVANVPDYTTVAQSSRAGWRAFWLSGGAVDFGGSTDPRASELERRVVLSQYLTRVQGAGTSPPQETGLTYNSWFGKPHMEMYWWHAAHFALWNRTDLLERSMGWYTRALPTAQQIATRQGYEGVRWPKMTDPDGGETASSVGSFLLWQQPHPIYLAELIYRAKPDRAVLQRYKDILFETADFMASFAHLNPATGRYDLGPGVMPAQECFNPVETVNPPYELAYWRWGLQTAQRWRQRLGLPPNPVWQRVIDNLAPLAQQDGLYRAAENVTDSYGPNSNYTIDHPAVLAAMSTLPPNGAVDPATMQRTYDRVAAVWHWDHTWGWDFPLMAMTATRLGQPDKAVDALLRPVTTNTYLPNGHNYQTPRLTIYLPGNGGLLAAIALMCAGTDGNTIPTPGFPKDGRWQVRWEGLRPMP